jgi:hypothetical protein
MTPDCNAQAQEWAAIIREQGTLGGYGDLPTWDQLKDWIKKWPWIPIPPVLELLRRLTDIHVNWPGGNPFDDLPEPDDDGSWRCSDLTKWARDKGWELKEDGARAFRATDPTGQFMMVIRKVGSPGPRWGIQDMNAGTWIDPKTLRPDEAAGHRPIDLDC